MSKHIIPYFLNNLIYTKYFFKNIFLRFKYFSILLKQPFFFILLFITVNVNIKMYKKWKIKMYNLGSTIHQLSYHQ